MSILYVGTKSASRRMLLDQAKIPYVLVSQDADESVCDVAPDLQSMVTAIALQKMNHVVLPTGKEGDVCFVLTADTLSQDAQGVIAGKPKDTQEAVAMIKAARGGVFTGTAFCLARKRWVHDKWYCEEYIIEYVKSECVFNVPDEWIESYLHNSPALNASGAITIEDYGMQFLTSVNGSYSAIIGLPMVELRKALEKLNFFSHVNTL
ncbi:Maf-like protein [Candidatus Dependentiae bacterium Noda2021]|nr:Maf-like protein [Candidatus Dependentiae bacterium Noda2021]